MTQATIHREVVILGTGPAGLTAAIYAGRADLCPLIIDAPADSEKQTMPGGQLMITTEVENFPGFANGIQGPDLMAEMRAQAERFGAEVLEQWVHKVDLSERPFKLYTEDKTIIAETLIISSGASAKWLNVPGEAKTPEGLGGNGVSACATCDGPLPMFRNQKLVIVGGGDTAMEEANFLSRYAARVYVIHRRDSLRASKIMQQKAMNNPKIEFLWNSAITEIFGTQEEGVKGVRLQDTVTNEEREFDCAGVFVAIGHKPNTELFKDVLDMDEVGYIKTVGRTMETNIAGVFACGDVQDANYRQAITAAGTGCMAAIDAERFLENAKLLGAEKAVEMSSAEA